MKKTEIVFVPSPGVGHLVSAVEIAKLLTDRDDRLSITVLIMKLPTDSKISTYTQSDPTSRIRFIDLPNDDSISKLSPEKFAAFFGALIESHKPHVREIAAEITRSESANLGGFVLDMFCTTMIDVANEFEVPSYVFFTSSASFLGLLFHIQSLIDDHKQGIPEFDSGSEMSVPSFRNPVPARVLPSAVLDKDGGGSTMFLGLVRRFKEMKGIIVNSFMELESYGFDSFFNGLCPPIYPVGPILNLKGTNFSGTIDKSQQTETIIRWLDDQPAESVVFLCFGSMGSFDGDQVREISIALERSGSRFLWSLRQPPPKGKLELPAEYTDLEEVLPSGFLERTAEIGKVIGWAPQVAILSHPSVGGFVSHCGWNSTLESIWNGVPIAAWPMYAEQQMNAFELVKELELAVEIKLDYRKNFISDDHQLVAAEEIETGIRKLMVERSDVRERVKEMKEKGRAAVEEGGSSYTSIGRFIEDVIENV